MLDDTAPARADRFSLIAVNVDSGYKDYKHDVIAKTCEARGWEYRIEHTVDRRRDEDDLSTPTRRPARCARGCGAACSIDVATEVGATKIALGHHLDDFIETLLLNLFFAGALKAMPARLVSDNGEHVVIRPLVYVERRRGTLVYQGSVSCRLSAAAVRRAATSACSDSASKRLILDLEQRASRRQAVDVEGARQRDAAPSARHAAQSAANCATAPRPRRTGLGRRTGLASGPA